MSHAERSLRRIWKIAQAVVANVVFGFPGCKLRVVGVTGTDGKTTTVHLIVTALESAGYTVGAVSTIHYQVGTRTWVNTSKLTTPGPWALAGLLAHMVRAGCHYAVLECTSHRLDQGGLWGIPVDIAVITNISREHFDYHRTFEDYTRAKERLFNALRHRTKVLPYRSGIDRGGRIATVAVANLDDERTAGVLERAQAERKYGFSLEVLGMKYAGERDDGKSTTVVSARRVGPPDTPYWIQHSPLYVVRAGDHEALLNLRLPGTFNLQNALAAIAVGVSQDIELARITRELSEVERIPGRMDRVKVGQPFTVLVDYAVTPAAFEALYREVRRATPRPQASIPKPQVVHVFGAAGERDRGKRPLLGEIAAKNVDLVILTDEDPFNEDPEQILDEIERGLRDAGAQPLAERDTTHSPVRESGIVYYTTSESTRGREGHDIRRGQDSRSRVSSRASVLRIRDRRLAIREALRRAQPGDVVLVTGKGAEETMALGARRIPWNDRRVIEEELDNLGSRR